MLLTLFYMVATWIQAWRLSSLKARLAAALVGPEIRRPSIVFCAKTSEASKSDEGGRKTSRDTVEDALSSQFCDNRGSARLGDLLWCHGDMKLCTVYPQQKIEVSEWLLFPKGKAQFPFYVQNHGQANLNDSTKLHVLIEADAEIFHPQAYTKTTRLEDYGNLVTWTIEKDFATILETDLDHMTKLSIALMHGKCFINNGLLLTRLESVAVTGKPCIYNYEEFISHHHDKKLVGKAQWEAYMKKLRSFGSAAKQVGQRGAALEIEGVPGAVISPGSQPVNLHIPVILEIKIPLETVDNDMRSTDDLRMPSTPPPTPAVPTGAENETASKLSKEMNELFDLNPAEIPPRAEQPSNDSDASVAVDASKIADPPAPEVTRDSNASILPDPPKIVGKSFPIDDVATAPRREFSTSTSHFTPAKKLPANYSTNLKNPNVLIYADSTIATENIKNVLELILDNEKYILYALTADEARRNIWRDQTVLVIVCGTVGAEVSGQLVEYMVRGGQLLALCSDALHTLLPSFKTAEVREHELVRFSYGKWKHVQMMHHIFCYQASPVKTRFSQENEDSRTTAPHTPESANVRDCAGKSHTFQVKVLATEETWHTPSIILANLAETGGRAIFSQIHLEADPSQYEFEEKKFNALKQSNNTRLEIFKDLLSTHFAMSISAAPAAVPKYSSGFFLGRHELKLEMLERLKKKMGPNDVLKTAKMDLQFCGTTTKPMTPTASLLPIMVHQCPDNFSTVDYFENLKTKELGRLVVYADVMTSSMNVVAGVRFPHGFTVIPRQQTQGQGRNKNVWLSPMGCAMYTMQLHIPLSSEVGSHLPILQHLVSVATVTAVTSLPGYENIDLRLKWPNDIYAGSATKIGGLIVTTLIESSTAICNIGVGVNLSNSSPTCCINDVISAYNDKNGTKLSKLSYEQFLALIFTELEKLLSVVQDGKMSLLFELYYKYWMHTDSQITVITADGKSLKVEILGIDKDGFLEVREKNGKVFTVHPDGNSFDILKGLIAPITRT